MKILKVISLLLDYPGEELQQHGAELIEAVNESDILSAENRQNLLQWIESLQQQDLLDAQESYTGLFDRGRALSLLLFEHVHGESRDRGQAMVDLMAVYQKEGFEIGVRELPDYIPLFLEFLSIQPEQKAREWLGEVAHILGRLSARLYKKQSRYYQLFDILLDLASNKVDMDEIREQVDKEKPDDTPEQLDKVWEEEAVSFGGSAVSGGCADYRPAPGQRVDAPDKPQQVRWVDAPKAQANGL